MGYVHEMLGQTAKAEEAYRRSIDCYRQLAVDFPETLDYRKALVQAWNRLAVLHVANRQLEDANRAFEEAIRLMDDFPTDYRTTVEYQHALASFRHNQAMLLISPKRERHQEAEPLCREALAIYEELLRQSPDDSQAMGGLANASNTHAIILKRLNRLSEAQASFEKSLEKFESLRVQFSEEEGIRAELGTVYTNYADLLERVNQPAEARKAVQKALPLLQGLVQDFPKVPRYHSELGETLQRYALSFSVDQRAEARTYLLQAIEHQQIACRTEPANTRYRGKLRNHYYQIAQLTADMGDYEEAVKLTMEMLKLADRTMDFIFGTAIQTQCADLAQKDTRLPPDRRNELAESYLRQAVELLRTAGKTGRMSAEHLRKDMEFAPLRSRPDFQRVVTELDQKKGK
jgi:tetratricopeptide (TPR) repeat protein